jgi:ABC-type antimicrobial peptide transport system permease subunit
MVFMFVSMLVVLICMIGLMSTLTMNVLDRTKEIGMLRCIGARARDIRRMFSTEGLFLALVGWGVGLPLGGLIGFFLQAQIKDTMRMQLPVYYAWAYIPWAFLVTVVGTLLVIQVPMLRATRFKPGDALRYQ